MSQELINHSYDLKRLQNEGFCLEISEGYAVVHKVAYVNSNTEIKYGTLISNLSLKGNITDRPDPHTIYFIGEYPCSKDGLAIESIRHNSSDVSITSQFKANHMFSNKPQQGFYDNYYEKFLQYIKILSSPAISIDDTITLAPFEVIPSNNESVFNYMDTNSSRADIVTINNKLKDQRIGIIGVGGTGSYVLDFIAKTPVNEIHIFDGDDFLQHNAFRAPGAPNVDTLQLKMNKAKYMQSIYSNMHNKISTHEYYLSADNINELDSLDHVFICIDNGYAKSIIISYLTERNKSFSDLGMGIQIVDNSIIGTLRATSAFSGHYDHVASRITFDDGNDDEYTTNIQIAELNALNAIMGVIHWKKKLGFYLDNANRISTFYMTNTEVIIDENIV